jgi:L-ribulose-5-phosphate 4-epimerase
MLEDLKTKVCNANKSLLSSGLVILTWGNVSAIDPSSGIVAIKPSGVPYDVLKAEDIALVDLEGRIIEGDKKPSSDTNTHLEIYRNFRNDVASVIHTHSTYATIYAQAKKEIPCIGTTHADYFYGPIPVTRDLKEEEIQNDYELNIGKVIVEHFRTHNLDPSEMPACLVASHGPFVWGASIDEALEHALILETVAKMSIYSQGLAEGIGPIDEALLRKHYFRKHGDTSYYGQ